MVLTRQPNNTSWSTSTMKKNNLLLLLAMTAIVVIPEPALASTTISQFNTPFENFVGLLTGPVGKFMSI
ncbi:TrbC/VirB2 family protein, partial [Maridesulfovibrio hydrothermalis]|uniref:TrbC/VirB2 family protein n=1 Tax=Maridesulfovibrio hydrothermalis TaxID=191026 RepID=UPI0028524ECB